MKLAIIPARGGSKRILKKNIKFFGGKPIIAWSIERAIESKIFDKIIVSTDDVEVATIAREYGAETPFIRPSELSGDYVSTTPVVAHAISWLKSNNEHFNFACCIYATAPFIRADEIIQGFEYLNNNKLNYTFSVTPYSYPIQRAVRLNSDNRIEMFQPECFNKRSQDLETAYHDAGQFYWGKSEAWLNRLPIFSQNSGPIVLPRYRVHDLDTHEDWHEAELYFNFLKFKSI